MPSERVRIRYYTPGEANEALPAVSRLLDAATDRARRYQQIVAAVREGGSTDPRARRAALREAEQLRREVMELLEELSDLGVEIKGLEQGLVDFPALRRGVEVLLCWRRGESEVAFWHTAQGGFAARQPIADEDEDAWVWFN